MAAPYPLSSQRVCLSGEPGEQKRGAKGNLKEAEGNLAKKTWETWGQTRMFTTATGDPRP